MPELTHRQQPNPRQALRRSLNRAAEQPTPDHDLAQRALGNQAMQHLLRTQRIRPKLDVNEPGDPFEQEADWLADHVLRMPEPGAAAVRTTGQETIQRQVDDEEEEAPIQATNLAGAEMIQRQADDEEEEETPIQATDLANAGMIQRQADDDEEEETPIQATDLANSEMIQRQADDEEEEETPIQAKNAPSQQAAAPSGVSSQISGLKGKGQPLSSASRDFFEPRFGRDFGGVRVHSGPQAASLARSVQARAFTVGRDVVFGAGEYAPTTSSGRWLLAHELAHTAQNGNAPQASPAGSGALEAEASRAADATSAGGTFQPQQAARPGQHLTVPVATGPGRVEFLGNRIILNNFDIERSNLKPQWLPAIVLVALILNLNPAKEAEIEGHTDSTGGETLNLNLSMARANTIQAALEALVLESEVASPMTLGFGEGRPIDSNATEAGRARNRRVEIRIVDRPLPTVERVDLLNSAASRTFDIAAAAPVAGSDHGVTVSREAAANARVRAVLNPPLAPGDRRLLLLSWTGATQDAANPLEADVVRTRGQHEAVARLSAPTPPLRASQAKYTVWSVDASIASGTPAARVLPRVSSRRLTMDGLTFNVQVQPGTLFSAADAPNMHGTAAPPTPVPGAGTPHPMLGGDLANGVNARWDVSRRIRTKYLFPAHLTAVGLDASAPPFISVPVPAYPANRLTGNDDRGTGDPEDNNPYADGQMSGFDQPAFNVDDGEGRPGDTFEARFQFQEFIRLDLGGAWRQISPDHPWKVHWLLDKASWFDFYFGGQTEWRNAGSFGALDNAGF